MLTSGFRAFGGEELVRDFLQDLPGGFWVQFIVVMLVIFLLGFFLDFIEIAVVVVPIIAPILLAETGANVSAIWLGVMIGVNHAYFNNISYSSVGFDVYAILTQTFPER